LPSASEIYLTIEQKAFPAGISTTFYHPEAFG